MEVARSNMANPSLMEAKGGCPPGARDAAGGFSQVSRVESINASAPPADAAAARRNGAGETAGAHRERVDRRRVEPSAFSAAL